MGEMSAAEVQAYQRMRADGMPDAVARASILKSRIAAQRMNQQFGLKTPTEAETKFPKGMRGKAAKPSARPDTILSMQIPTENGMQSVGSIVAEMQKAGTSQQAIDRWLQGLELSTRIQGAKP
jgi:hypothetical protein